DCVLALWDAVLAGGLFTAAVFEVFAAGGGAAPGPWVGVEPVTPLKDFTYAIRARSCSSVTCPLNVGMIGEKPSTICELGSSIELRIYASSATTVDPPTSFTCLP